MLIPPPLRIKIIGAGPTGALLALAMSRAGSQVSLYDSLDEESLLARSRAYALTHSSRELLDKLSLWEPLSPFVNSFTTLHLEDRGLLKKVNFELNDLNKSHLKYGAIGWIVDHKSLMKILYSRISQDPNILFELLSESSSSLDNNDLVVAADGPTSFTRRSWGIRVFNLPYRQGCLTAKVIIRGANESTAHEILRPEGPLALLPMGGEIFQVVWSAPISLCKERAAFTTSQFLDQLAAILPYGFEPDILLESPTAFPMRFSLSLGLGSRNKLLIGESAHRFHPVGGQGLNVCWRDVQTLMHLIEKYNNGMVKRGSLLTAYSAARFLDVLAIGVFTDLLVRVYSNRFFPLKVLRFFVITLISLSSSVRRFLLHFMTYGPTKFFTILSD